MFRFNVILIIIIVYCYIVPYGAKNAPIYLLDKFVRPCNILLIFARLKSDKICNKTATRLPTSPGGCPPPPSVWPHLFCGAGHEKRRGEQLKWSLAYTLYIGNFPCAQLPGPVHTARLGRVCLFCVHI